MRGTRPTCASRIVANELVMDAEELYATAIGSLLVLVLGWQMARVGDAFRKRGAQLIRKNLCTNIDRDQKKGIFGLYRGFWSRNHPIWKIQSYSFGIIIAILVLGITSLLYIRRSFYEVFLKLHLSISIGIIASTGLWSFEKAIWLGSVVLARLRKVDELTIISSQDDVSSDVTMIEVRSQQPRKIIYGQHIFITVPSIPHSMVGRLQAHPYMIAWEHKDGSSQILTLLIAHRSGFSNVIRLSASEWQHISLAIRHLVQAHNDKTSRVRRLSLLWFLETDEQEPWARRFLFDLMKQDSERRILTVYLYRPFQGKNSSPPTFTQPYSDHQRIYDVRSALDIDWLLQEEWAAEAGTMAVSRKSLR
ncbi:hypothetical protein Q7P37_004896 [Cladosporium fusiforme]